MSLLLCASLPVRPTVCYVRAVRMETFTIWRSAVSTQCCRRKGGLFETREDREGGLGLLRLEEGERRIPGKMRLY